jgi:D-alanyl-D-alanine carboxypeptidase
MRKSAILPALVLSLLLEACQPSNSTSPASSDSLVQQTVLIDSPPPSPAEETPAPPEAAVEAVPLATLIGKIDPAKDTAFVKIGSQYTSKPDIYLRKAAYAAFQEMHAAALKDGIKLEIISATRNFSAQKGIWERKWDGGTLVGGKNLAQTEPDPAARALKILSYSSMPTTSRHHWGTDVDLNNLENSYFASGTGKKIYDWLIAHAPSYGFCQTYTAIGPERPHGYQEEKWHWSYMPIASRFLKAFKAQVKYSDITGFKGAEVAEGLHIIDHFVGGIAPACREW